LTHDAEEGGLTRYALLFGRQAHS